MWNREKQQKRRKLSEEILGLFGATAAVALFFFTFFSKAVISLAISYSDKNGISHTEDAEWMINSWIQSVSFFASMVTFIVLFLFLVGEKLAYINQITLGIEALRMHRMDYQIQLQGNNELTELAERINFLSRTEKEFQEKEATLQKEREELIRALSHDIRTPLTSLISYTEFIQRKNSLERQEIEEYISMVHKKAGQIKELTNLLLEEGIQKQTEVIDGRLLLAQLMDEWEMELEEDFTCHTDLKECPNFSGRFDIQQFRRIFDNLASNIRKYADSNKEVSLRIFKEDKRLVILQQNRCRKNVENVESSKIGIDSIRRIAKGYGGNIEVTHDETEFSIKIILMEINL
ncbi:MAG: sensor histidine kinase [Lachnospiraceae bacterium]|nr:sensor histidine kinase [Lachnospiraceae bacterium]